MEINNTGKLTPGNALLIAVVTVALAVFSVWLVVPAPPVGFYWDDTWYLVMAEWLSSTPDFREYSWAMLTVTSYPPLFPLFIHWSGADLYNQQNAFIMNALFLTSTVCITMIWFVREGFSSIAFSLAAALIAFNPITLGYLPILYSEFLFTLLITTALALAALNVSWRWNSKWLIVGAIVGLAIATRSAGWALSVGLLIHLALNRSFRPILAMVVGLGVGILIIPFLTVGVPPSAGYLDLLAGHLENFGWVFLKQQFQGLAIGWDMLWGWGRGAWLAIAIVVPGLIIRLRKNKADAWFILAYLGMLLVWPFPGHMGRFLWPLLPCFFLSAHSSFGLIPNEKLKAMLPAILFGVILLLSIPDGIGRTLERLISPPGNELIDLSRKQEWTRSSSPERGLMMLEIHQQLLNDMHLVDSLVDSDDCIYSELSSLVAIQTRQVSFAPPWNTPDQLDTNTLRCRYYYMVPPFLNGFGTDDVEKFSTKYEELFKSKAPDDPEGKQFLGVFYRLYDDKSGS